jgi:hypothetical protein
MIYAHKSAALQALWLRRSISAPIYIAVGRRWRHLIANQMEVPGRELYGST